MKQERCPNCNGKLAIPEKKRGRSVECPFCELEFIPTLAESAPQAPASSAKSNATRKSKSESRKRQPAPRSIPVPSTIVETTGPRSQHTIEATAPDPLLPPKKSRLDTLAPGSKEKNSGRSGRPDPPVRPVVAETVADSLGTETSRSKESNQEASGDSASAAHQPATQDSGRAPQQENAVAKIIKTEAVQTLITKDGKLPTLQLKENNKPKKTETSLSSNPLFVGLLVCASLVSSGVMVLMFGMPSTDSRKTVAEARENIRQFYEVRVDEELKPYQIELREAQLAHSRGDHQAEIAAYQSVLARFRAEDRNQYTGLTGSPTWDAELEDLVTILLKEANRENKSFLN